jgi:hypothetical protein
MTSTVIQADPTAYAFGRARHYCHFIRQPTHIFTVVLDPTPVRPNVHRCELRLARMKISIYAFLKTARQHSILHPERIVGNLEVVGTPRSRE